MGLDKPKKEKLYKQKSLSSCKNCKFRKMLQSEHTEDEWTKQLAKLATKLDWHDFLKQTMKQAKCQDCKAFKQKSEGLWLKTDFPNIQLTPIQEASLESYKEALESFWLRNTSKVQRTTS